MAKQQATDTVAINAVNKGECTLKIVGDTTLICHKFSAKARKMMLDKQQKKANGPKTAKDPQRDFEESLYQIPDTDGKYGFPASAFKNAIVRAADYVDGLTMVKARGLIFCEGADHQDLVTLEYQDLRMREDVVRLQGKTADIRFRGEFVGWAGDLVVHYDADSISTEQIANLVERAGFSVGIGEWRPEKNGNHGRFHVARDAAAG